MLSDCDGIVLPLSAAQREVWFAEQRLNMADRRYGPADGSHSWRTVQLRFDRVEV